MTYYAVTNDPEELMHFGVEGMKWGVIRTPEQLGHHKPPKKARTKTSKPKENKPRSPAYQKASSKLDRAMRAGIAKAQANWREYNSPENKAERAYNRAMKRDERAYRRNEKAFQKHLQLAREGRLKYKGISDEEVGRITDRLALERSSRLLSGTEKQSFGRRLRERVGEGVIEGAGRGVAGYVDARITTRGRTTAEIKAERRKIRAQYTPSGQLHRALNNRYLDKQNKRQYERESEKENYKYANDARRIQEKKDTEAKARSDAEESYLALVEENRMLGFDPRHTYSTNPKDISRLTDAEIKGRTKALESVHKVYEKENDAKVKALYGGKDIKRINPETHDEETVTEYAGMTRDELGSTLPTRPYDRSRSSSPDTSRPVSFLERSAREREEREAREAREKAKDEGLAYFIARRKSRERNPVDEYLPGAITRAEAEAYRREHGVSITKSPEYTGGYGHFVSRVGSGTPFGPGSSVTMHPVSDPSRFRKRNKSSMHRRS